MKTTFSRTIVSLAAILLVTLLLVGFSFQLLVQNYMEGQAMSRLKKNCTLVAELAAAEGNLSGQNLLTNLTVISDITNSDSLICDARGNLLHCSEDPFSCQHRGLSLNKDYRDKVLSQEFVMSHGTLKGIYNDDRYVVGAPIRSAEGEIVGIVISTMSTTATGVVLHRLSDRFLMVSLLVVLGAAVVVTIYAKKHSSPLRDMSRAAIAFGHGDLKARVNVPKKAPQEVQELALAFNNMAASLEKSEYQRREFVANVSHELKTPMTTIGGFVDGMLDGTIPADQHSRYLQVVSDETKRLSRLVRSMLDISRLQEQEGIAEEKRSRFELAECMGQTLLTFEQAVSDKNLSVNVDFPEHPVYVKACRDYITQVIYNLLDNAVKFCPNGGQLGAKIAISGNKAYVTVSNDGPTIPQEELPLLFDRFHKVDKSRSENRDGWGLGLYIVKTMILSHGEDISVTSDNGVTAFTFTLTLVN